MTQQFHSLVYTQKNWKYLCTQKCESLKGIIYNGQKVSITKCPSTDEYINKCDFPYHGIVFINKKEGNADAY